MNLGEPLLFVKYDRHYLNVLDVEKQSLILKDAVRIGNEGDFILFFFIFHRLIEFSPYWIDVCPSDGNFLASCGRDRNVKVYDRRESRVVKIFDGFHTGEIYRVVEQMLLVCSDWSFSSLSVVFYCSHNILSV
mgnify:CR=1 FL=1